MYQQKFLKDVLIAVTVIGSLLALCRVTMGGAAVVVALMGAVFAIQRKAGLLAACYAFFPMLTIFNRVVIGMSAVTLMTARIGNLFMIAAMMLTGAGFRGRVREKLPISMLFAYCLVACISSIDGWMPFISYMKLFQFVLFLLGLLFLTRILQQSDKGLYQLRCVFMAIAVIFLVGSIVSYFIPSLGFSMQIAKSAVYGIDVTGTELAQSGELTIFNGMANHSQALAPVVSIIAAWVLCDMLLVERKFTWLHGLNLLTVPILLYISRSRGGLLEIVAVLATVMLVCVPRARLTAIVKSKLTKIMVMIVVVLAMVGVIAQFRNQSLSKWIRKTDDVKADNRSLSEAFTGSRQALIEYNLNDFKLNPIFGKGFQVVRGMEQAYRAHIITWYSAAVEKGVTPYVILGETGIFGALVFLVFLFVFYGTCLKRRYLSTLTMFTCFLIANLADSTFFSPGGCGGFLWIASCVGGFGIDMISIRQAHGIWRGPGDDRFGNHLPPPGIPPPPRPKRKTLSSGRVIYTTS